MSPFRCALALVLSIAAAGAAGCARKADLDGRLAELAEIRDAACQCPDIECARYQQTAYTAWNFRNDSTDKNKMTMAQREKYAAYDRQLAECLMKFAHNRHALPQSTSSPAGSAD